MTPDSAKTHDEALEALIAASLRVPDTESELTSEDISRYMDQLVTLNDEDEDALKRSEAGLMSNLEKILRVREKIEADYQDIVSAGRVEMPSGRQKPASQEFVEAVVIAQITRLHSSPAHPLGRKRCQKLAYLSHRKAEDDVHEHFLKKAAGPYSPWARYQGPEKIAVQNGYIQRTQVGVLAGFIVGDKIAQIELYLARYPVCAAVSWAINSFRYRKNDELELLSTVDFAALDLNRSGASITLSGVKHIIATNKEWSAKLKREVFSDANIARALEELRVHFPATYINYCG